MHEHAAFLRDAINVWRFPDHQAAMIAARLHPADVIAHDKQDVGFLVLRLDGCDRAHQRGERGQYSKAVIK